MINAASTALGDILLPPFRGVLVKSLVLTVGLLVALWLALEWLLTTWIATSWPWLNTAFDILAGGVIHEVGIDAANGTILENVVETAEDEAREAKEEKDKD